MAPSATIDRSIHSDHAGTNEEACKRRGMKDLIFSSAMKVMKSYKVSKDDIHSVKNIELTYSEASDSSMSNSFRDDDTEEQDESKELTESSPASGTEHGILEGRPSLYNKKLKTRTIGGKSKGRVGHLRRSGERRRTSSLKGLDTESFHSQTSISNSSHHRFDLLRECNSEDDAASSDGDSLLKESSSFACCSSQHSQLDHSQQSHDFSFHPESNSSYLELDLESMETSLHPSTNSKKPSAHGSSGHPVTVRSESLNDILITTSLHKTGGRRVRGSNRMRGKLRPGPSRSKSLDLEELKAGEDVEEILESFSKKIDSIDLKNLKPDGSQFSPRQSLHNSDRGGETISLSRHRVSRAKSTRHAADKTGGTSSTRNAEDNLQIITASQGDQQMSRPASSSSRPRRYRPSREIDV